MSIDSEQCVTDTPKSAPASTPRIALCDPKSKWEELPGGTHLQGMNLAAHKGKVICVGGMEPRNKKGEKTALFSTDEAVSYDPTAKKCGKLPTLSEPRSLHDLVVIGDKLFVLGGWKLDGKGKSGAWHDTALVLDLAAEKPFLMSFAQPFKGRAKTASAHEGKPYVLGGLPGEGPVNRSMFTTGRLRSGQRSPRTSVVTAPVSRPHPSSSRTGST